MSSLAYSVRMWKVVSTSPGIEKNPDLPGMQVQCDVAVGASDFNAATSLAVMGTRGLSFYPSVGICQVKGDRTAVTLSG